MRQSFTSQAVSVGKTLVHLPEVGQVLSGATGVQQTVL